MLTNTISHDAKRTAAHAMWGFPRHKPQFFSRSRTALASAAMYYSFGRRIPRSSHFLIAASILAPGVGRLLIEGCRFAPSCGWDVWQEIEANSKELRGAPNHWVFFQSQWKVQPFSAFPINRFGRARGFVHVCNIGHTPFHPSMKGTTFRVPRLCDEYRIRDWRIGIYEPLPRLHRATCWDAKVVGDLVHEISLSLEPNLEKPRSLPLHWRPIHGDLTPTNLRTDHRNRLWLIDWEHAAWGPPAADLLYFASAIRSMKKESPSALADWIRGNVRVPDAELSEAATFWLGHEHLQVSSGNERSATKGKAVDIRRGQKLSAAFRLLAQS